jgi:hypothetical protein
LKHVENARTALGRCNQVVEEQLPKIGLRQLGPDWRDWIIAHVLLTEAKSLIEAGSDPKNNATLK